MAIRKLLATIFTATADAELRRVVDEMAIEIERLQQELQATKAKLAMVDQRVYRDRIKQLQQTVTRLEVTNRDLERRLTSQTTVVRPTGTGKRKRRRRGWRRDDLRALRRFQNLPLDELAVMFGHHYSIDDIQSMLTKIKNEKAE